MFRFLYPYFFLLLIPIALLGVYSFFRIVKLRKTLKRFGDSHLVKELMPDLSLKRKVMKDVLMISAFVLLTFALARPQMGSRKETVKREGIEVMICMDISNSMLSDDVKPSRLILAKSLISRLVDRMTNDRIGMVLFAGEAFVQLPITSDYVSAKMFLDNADPSMIETQGTEIAKAIRLASRSFTSTEGMQRAIILITDGENHEGQVAEAVKDARDKGILVNVIGIGTENGGPIPLRGAQADRSGRTQYLTDEQGNMVITKLNQEMCREIASQGGGIYIRANDVSNTARLVQKSLDKLEKSELDATIYSAYDEKYYFFLIPALLLMALDLILLDRKNRYLKGIKLFDKK